LTPRNRHSRRVQGARPTCSSILQFNNRKLALLSADSLDSCGNMIGSNALCFTVLLANLLYVAQGFSVIKSKAAIFSTRAMTARVTS
jgi:hypothetical protein